ncbi:MAG TPA: subclass B3 metallo-beta-lactamase [Cyclobacteriaceae bacterium]|nr:subclass B3 metallo-beta-lactamase [Cyclobacteriaceae bacterium]
MNRTLALTVLGMFSLFTTTSAQDVKEPQITNKEWAQPYEPFRIVGNVYYVGTYDLSCYLIVTTQGNILINTGLAASTPIIKSNIETLGFKLSDIKILLTTQAHYDHVGAMAEIKKMTGAELWADEKDAPVIEDGGKSDYELGKNGVSFQPVKVDKRLKDGDEIKLGDTRLTMLHHPGHTKGSCSYSMDVKDDGKIYKVLIANMPTIVTPRRFGSIPLYSGIAEDYAYTFNALKNLDFDLWLSSHAGQFNLHAKRKPGDPYNPEVFRDREGYDASLQGLDASYKKKIEEK